MGGGLLASRSIADSNSEKMSRAASLRRRRTKLYSVRTSLQPTPGGTHREGVREEEGRDGRAYEREKRGRKEGGRGGR